LPPMGIDDPFVGRDAEVLGLTGLFLRDNHRLVTMTGVRGVGKSRLALEVSRNLHFRDRVSALWGGSSGTAPGNETSSGIPGPVNLKVHQLLVDNCDDLLAELIGERNSLLVPCSRGPECTFGGSGSPAGTVVGAWTGTGCQVLRPTR
jgi:hypothetical protein